MAIVDADTPIPSKASLHYLFYNRMSVSIELGVEHIHHTIVAWAMDYLPSLDIN